MLQSSCISNYIIKWYSNHDLENIRGLKGGKKTYLYMFLVSTLMFWQQKPVQRIQNEPWLKTHMNIRQQQFRIKNVFSLLLCIHVQSLPVDIWIGCDRSVILLKISYKISTGLIKLELWGHSIKLSYTNGSLSIWILFLDIFLNFVSATNSTCGSQLSCFSAWTHSRLISNPLFQGLYTYWKSFIRKAVWQPQIGA